MTFMNISLILSHEILALNSCVSFTVEGELTSSDKARDNKLNLSPSNHIIKFLPHIFSDPARIFEALEGGMLYLL